jgi:drug/metabolite transporter (DMT)-like permease
LLPKPGVGKDDKKIWGKYPHETHTSWVTALYLMVMSFLREIVFTIFSTIPIKGETASTAGQYFSFILLVCFCVAVGFNSWFYMVLYAAWLWWSPPFTLHTDAPP